MDDHQLFVILVVTQGIWQLSVKLIEIHITLISTIGTCAPRVEKGATSLTLVIKIRETRKSPPAGGVIDENTCSTSNPDVR
jgi:hypothetical protein